MKKELLLITILLLIIPLIQAEIYIDYQQSTNKNWTNLYMNETHYQDLYLNFSNNSVNNISWYVYAPYYYNLSGFEYFINGLFANTTLLINGTLKINLNNISHLCTIPTSGFAPCAEGDSFLDYGSFMQDKNNDTYAVGLTAGVTGGDIDRHIWLNFTNNLTNTSGDIIWFNWTITNQNTPNSVSTMLCWDYVTNNFVQLGQKRQGGTYPVADNLTWSNITPENCWKNQAIIFYDVNFNQRNGDVIELRDFGIYVNSSIISSPPITSYQGDFFVAENVTTYEGIWTGWDNIDISGQAYCVNPSYATDNKLDTATDIVANHYAIFYINFTIIPECAYNLSWKYNGLYAGALKMYCQNPINNLWYAFTDDSLNGSHYLVNESYVVPENCTQDGYLRINMSVQSHLNHFYLYEMWATMRNCSGSILTPSYPFSIDYCHNVSVYEDGMLLYNFGDVNNSDFKSSIHIPSLYNNTIYVQNSTKSNLSNRIKLDFSSNSTGNMSVFVNKLIYKWNYSINYSTNIYDKQPNTFILNITGREFYQEGNLTIWNGFDNFTYPATRYIDGNYTIFTSSFTYNYTNSSAKNLKAWFNVFFNNSPISWTEQQVYPLNMSMFFNQINYLNLTAYKLQINNCSQTNASIIYNVTIMGEDNLSALTTRLFAQFIMYNSTDESNSVNYTFNLSGSSNYAFCLESDLKIFVNTYMVSISNQSQPYYAFRDYVKQGNVTQIYLYNFDSYTGTSYLQLDLRNRNNFATFPNVIVKLLRFYNDINTWKVVQYDKSDTFGSAIFDIYQNDVKYRLLFFDKDNHLLNSSNDLRFLCTNYFCQATFILPPYTGTSPRPSLRVWDNSESQEFNLTKVLNVSWVDDMGIATSIRIEISKNVFTGNQMVCNQTMIGNAGFYACNLSGIEGEVFLKVYATASPETQLLGKWIKVISAKLSQLIGTNEGAFWSVGLFITIVGAGAFSPVVAIIMGIFALILISVMGLLSALTITAIIIAIVMGLVIGLKIKR